MLTDTRTSNDSSRRRAGRRGGVQALELILATPVIVITLVAILQFGTAQLMESAVTEAVTVAAREAGDGADIDQIVVAANAILQTHKMSSQSGSGSIAIDDTDDSGTTLFVQRRTDPMDYESFGDANFTCTPPTTPVLAADEVRVTICIKLNRADLLNASVTNNLGFSMSDSADGYFRVSAVAKKQYALFSDNFNRAPNSDVDGASDGMSGILAPEVYVEPRDASPGPVQQSRIDGQELQIGNGTSASHVAVMHNFGDNEILDADGFVVSLEIDGFESSTANDSNWIGFGVGLSATEGSDNSLNQIKQQADLFVALSRAGNLLLFEDNTQVGSVNVSATSGIISARFEFAAGSTVNYTIYFDGALKTSDSFTWSGTSENYIGVDASEGGTLDNLLIDALR